MKFFSGKKHGKCATSSHESRQALGSAPSGHEAQGRASMSEDGVRGRDAVMTGQRQVESSTHAVAMNRGIDRGGKPGDSIHEVLPHSGECDRGGAGERANFREIRPRGEKSGIAGNDQRLGSALQCSQSFDHFENTASGQAIGFIGRDQLQPAMTGEIVDLQMIRHKRFAGSARRQLGM